MAYVQVITNKQRADGRPSYTGLEITHEQAEGILAVLNGEREPENDEQRKFCEKVHKIFFSWRSAPPTWIMENMIAIIPFVLSEWAVDASGKPTRPDNEHSWEFAKRYQLYANKRPASYALHYINNMELTSRGYK